MANNLKTEQRSTERNSLSTDMRRDVPLARVQAFPWMVVIVLLAAVAWLAWRAFFYEEEGDPVGSAMLAFEKQNSLTVFSSRFEVVAESEDRRGIMGVDVLTSRQAAIVPANVEYRLDLSGMERGDFVWDEAGDRLTVTLPVLADASTTYLQQKGDDKCMSTSRPKRRTVPPIYRLPPYSPVTRSRPASISLNSERR